MPFAVFPESPQCNHPVEDKHSLPPQVCTATTRIYVEDAIYDKFVEMFVAETKQTSKVGAPFDDGTFQGPQVSQAQYEKVLKYIDIGTQEGAKVELGGAKEEGNGYFIQPTVFSNVSLSTCWTARRPPSLVG